MYGVRGKVHSVRGKVYGVKGKVYGVRVKVSGVGCPLRLPWSSQTSDLKIGTLVAPLPGARQYGVRAGTGWPCINIL